MSNHLPTTYYRPRIASDPAVVERLEAQFREINWAVYTRRIDLTHNEVGLRMWNWANWFKQCAEARGEAINWSQNPASDGGVFEDRATPVSGPFEENYEATEALKEDMGESGTDVENPNKSLEGAMGDLNKTLENLNKTIQDFNKWMQNSLRDTKNLGKHDKPPTFNFSSTITGGISAVGTQINTPNMTVKAESPASEAGLSVHEAPRTKGLAEGKPAASCGQPWGP